MKEKKQVRKHSNSKKCLTCYHLALDSAFIITNRGCTLSKEDGKNAMTFKTNQILKQNSRETLEDLKG